MCLLCKALLVGRGANGDDCLLYVQQFGLAMPCQRQRPDYNPLWEAASRQTHPSFPWCGRRPRVSRDKIHACDSPGCGKTFYERCTLLRHQSLKHGRKAKYSRSSDDASFATLLTATLYDDAFGLGSSSQNFTSRIDVPPPSQNDASFNDG